MSEMDDRLKRLEIELDALRKIKTQEDYDEGARIHAEKNAPWMNGMYTHLKFPAYKFQAFPKMLYSLAYEAACQEYAAACMIPARGSEEGARDAAMRLAQRKKDQAIKTVHNQAEQDDLAGAWYESPELAVAATQANQHDIAVAAAHRAFEDRNMGERAKREIDAFDDQAEEFVAVIPETPKAGKRVKVAV